MENGTRQRRVLWGGGKKREVLRCERKQFRDRDRGFKVGETDERVIFVIFVMVSSLTDAYVLRLGDRALKR